MIYWTLLNRRKRITSVFIYNEALRVNKSNTIQAPSFAFISRFVIIFLYTTSTTRTLRDCTTPPNHSVDVGTRGPHDLLRCESPEMLV